MSRSIKEIKESIITDFMNNDAVYEIYEIEPGDSFSKHFSSVSLENILFYVFAAAAWILENLFDRHKMEVEQIIDEILPHRAKWYRDKTLKFMKGKALIEDTDRYDTSQMSENEIEELQVVKHAVAIEDDETYTLVLKVAGEKDEERCPLDEETEQELLERYLNQIKDAGVKLRLVNIPPDFFTCKVDIYYNPLLVADHVKADCEKAIKEYIQNLPFNGEYSNMELVNVLQKVEGVKVVALQSAESCPYEEAVWSRIDSHRVPEAGYFTPIELTDNINMKIYG